MTHPRPQAPRVWLVNLFFGAGPAPTGALLESVAVGLQRAGWEVEVLTGRSGYNRAAGAAAPRFTGPVRRLYSGPARAGGVLGRLLSWLAFYLAVAVFACTRRLPAKVVVMTTPPLLHALFALRNLVASRPAELILWNQDTYPETLAAVGLLRPDSPPYRLLAAVQCWADARADKSVALDAAMQGILTRHGARRIAVIPNWEIDPAPAGAAPADELTRAAESARAGYRYLVLYTGNYGWGHDLTVLGDHLRRHPGQTDFFFLFVGGGEKWSDLEALRGRDGLGCVAVFPYVPKARVPSLLRSADFGLVALERSCVGLMSPSKIHGYLAQGKPLLYLGPHGSNVADAIETYGCGFRVDEDDPAGLAACLSSLLEPGFDYQALSARAAHAAAARYTEAVGVRDVVAWVGDPLPGRRPGSAAIPANRPVGV